jgi:CheY-like chemotaxis protein
VSAGSGGAAEVRVLIVDDEDLARTIPREHLAKVGGLRVIGECANGFEAVRAAGELSAEIVFLDIELPKLNGFEVLELLHPLKSGGKPYLKPLQPRGRSGSIPVRAGARLHLLRLAALTRLKAYAKASSREQGPLRSDT